MPAEESAGASALRWPCSTRSSPATTNGTDAEDSASAIEDTVISEASRRKGRTSMPSWDEIVFGARTEDG
jgi:hypothetical protein